MEFTLLDWLIVGGYLLFALGVGAYYARRAGQDAEEYYLAGRSLPWWVLGTSMVATTFAADTPLAITETCRSKGIWENWFWWNWLLFGLLAVFLFARLWRRANVLTENELLELRYSGKPAAFLRIFKAGYFAIFYNLLVMAWVVRGMSDVMTVMLGDAHPGLTPNVIIGTLVTIAVVYSILSGFWGVVVTDVVQFVIAMAGAIFLAVVAVQHVGGIEALKTGLDETLAQQADQLSTKIDAMESQSADDTNDVSQKNEIVALRAKWESMPKSAEDALRVVPKYPQGIGVTDRAFYNTRFFEFLVYVVVMWWSNQNTDGGGYLIQRTMAAKDEWHALAANLWYNFANFALRTWPWVLVALASIVMFPDLSDHAAGDKAGYPLVMRELLGAGARGLLLVSFLAAFMSTIDTHLNWGSSYLVHDIYRRFFVKDKPEAHYVLAGRVFTVLLIVVAALVADQLTSIKGAWKAVMGMGGGIGLVLIVRWFWWRVNAWSEIAALAASLLISLSFQAFCFSQCQVDGRAFELFNTDPIIGGMPFPFHLQLLVIVGGSVVAWIVVTYLTPPEPASTLDAFYARVQPGGWWSPASDRVSTTMEPVTRDFLGNFIAGLAFVWGGTFFIGYLIFGDWMWAGIMLVVMLLGWTWMWFRCFKKIQV